jgi:peptidoglycan-associated lipoprotein
MIARYFMIFAAILVVSACSSTDDEAMGDQAGMEHESMTAGPLDDIYGENLGGPVPGSQEDLVVNVGDRVFFGYDRHDLSVEARAVLDAQAGWLQQYPNLSVTIEGHADERGTREYNLALGDRRANSVRDYLVALGVSPSRINTISYGKERPAVPGANDTAWAQNRRGVTTIQ